MEFERKKISDDQDQPDQNQPPKAKNPAPALEKKTPKYIPIGISVALVVVLLVGIFYSSKKLGFFQHYFLVWEKPSHRPDRSHQYFTYWCWRRRPRRRLSYRQHHCGQC